MATNLLVVCSPNPTQYIMFQSCLFNTAQKMKFSIKDFSSKWDQIRSFLEEILDFLSIYWRNP